MSVKNELSRLKKKVQRKAGMPTFEAMERYRNALADRINRKLAGEDVSGYIMPACPLPDSMVSGARERLAHKILEIADRRDKAEARAARENLATADEHATVADFVSNRMQEIDVEARGEVRPATRQIEETGNPLIARLRQRRKQWQLEEDEK
jgi:hypothetical protein